MKIILSLIFILINSLFIYKYGIRIQQIPIALLFSLYFLALFLILVFLKKFKKSINQYDSFKNIYIIIVVIISIVFLITNILIDGNNINVDRWSATSVCIDALLNGKYPYLVLDHLGNYSSNLPGLFLIGLFPYLIGDIGYLQVISFMLFSFLIYKHFSANYKQLLALVLLLISPAFLWHIIVKSDLTTNFIFVLGFIYLWRRKYSNDIFHKPILLGIITGVFVLTRVIVIIPLTLFLFSTFVKIDLWAKVNFIFALLFSMLLLLFPIYYTAESWQQIMEFNPLSLQSSPLPRIMSLFFMLIPFYFSYLIKNFNQFLWFSTTLVLLPVLASFMLHSYQLGILNTILQIQFDISYFSMILPFLIFLMVEHFESELFLSESN